MVEASIKHKTKQALSTPNEDLSTYDLVLQVYSPADAKTGAALPEASIGIQYLLKTLDMNRFKIAVRPDSIVDSFLVFIKVEDAEFEQLVKKAQKVDSLYGVSQLDSFDKITPADRLRLVNAKLTSPKSEGGAEITVGEGKWSYVGSCVPVSSVKATSQGLDIFKKSAYKFFDASSLKQQTGFLLKNFGTKYTFYFKVVSEYSVFLVVLSAVGLASQYFYGSLSKVFTALNLIIGASFYLCWYGSEKKWAKDWNVVNVGHVDVSRTDKKDPPYKVLLRKVLFAPIALGSSLNLVFYQFACFLIEIFLNEIYQGPGKMFLSLVPTILVCSIVPVCTFFYSTIISYYLKFENNPTKAAHSKSYLIKMFLYNFLSSYVPLLITSFVYLPGGYKVNSYLGKIDSFVADFSNRNAKLPHIPVLTKDYSVNSLRLKTQFTYFILTNQIVGVFMEFGLPFILRKLAAVPALGKLLGAPASAPVKDSDKEKELLAGLRHKLALPAYDVNDDYRQFILQFGFMIMFGPTWSSSVLISLAIELIQVKADFFKIMKLVRPPTADRAESSYPWPLFLKTLLIIGSFTSVAITLMYNGGDLGAYVDKSSVKTSLPAVFLAALISCLLMQAGLYFGESLIDEYYSDPGSETAKREKVICHILKNSQPSGKAASLNDVQSLITESLALTASTRKVVPAEKKGKKAE
ncbi:DEBR0S1_15874g1_1 [Brettanomyces bruxellensis]|uniref:DEBR0S1_15874g1_1 n=1 Tax=Dekkera bruxellensis TaxID=5007 RepID=A0A7D9CV46_DEKBR|nr:DEBR0S1_15874g1_1 [Brettanomyces bruxellensis]